MKLFAPIVIVATLALSGTAQSATNLISNGSFETGTFDGAPFDTLNALNNSINNWSLTGGSVDWIGSYWTAEDGARSLDMSGFQANGFLTQTIATQSGDSYLLSFWVSANPDDQLPNPRLGTAYVNGTPYSISYLLNAGSNTNSKTFMYWMQDTVSFTASGASTTIAFSGNPNTNGSFGIALDNVSVTAVPEPRIWAMLLIGFFGVGAMMRRTNRIVYEKDLPAQLASILAPSP